MPNHLPLVDHPVFANFGGPIGNNYSDQLEESKIMHSGYLNRQGTTTMLKQSIKDDL